MKISLTTTAKNNMAEIVRYISNDNPSAAQKLSDTIFEEIGQLISFPRLGRIVPEYSNSDIREIIIGQYRVVYKISNTDDIIHIVTIHHSSSFLPDDLPLSI